MSDFINLFMSRLWLELLYFWCIKLNKINYLNDCHLLTFCRGYHEVSDLFHGCLCFLLEAADLADVDPDSETGLGPCLTPTSEPPPTGLKLALVCVFV